MKIICTSSNGQTVTARHIYFNDGKLTITFGAGVTSGGLFLQNVKVKHMDFARMVFTADEEIVSGIGALPPSWEIIVTED